MKVSNLTILGVSLNVTNTHRRSPFVFQTLNQSVEIDPVYTGYILSKKLLSEIGSTNQFCENLKYEGKGGQIGQTQSTMDWNIYLIAGGCVFILDLACVIGRGAVPNGSTSTNVEEYNVYNQQSVSREEDLSKFLARIIAGYLQRIYPVIPGYESRPSAPVDIPL